MISGISDRAEFVRLRSDGLHVRSRDLRCRYLFEETDADTRHTPQIAYSISRKVGNAVIRNRIRRRLRAIFSEVLSVEQSPPLGAAMVIVLPGARELSFPQLRNQVLELMNKIELSTERAS